MPHVLQASRASMALMVQGDFMLGRSAMDSLPSVRQSSLDPGLEHRQQSGAACFKVISS